MYLDFQYNGDEFPIVWHYKNIDEAICLLQS